MGFHVVAPVFEDFARDVFVYRLDLLQQGHVGLRFVEPVAQRRVPGLDSVDVESGDFHPVGPVRVQSTDISGIFAERGRDAKGDCNLSVNMTL